MYNKNSITNTELRTKMVEKLNLIEQNLLGINPAKFQTLCCDYLLREYPQMGSFVNEYGKTLGADKVKKGVPDIYCKLPNGKYVFVECNTEKGNVFPKLKKDLSKCFKTGVPNDDIDTIFLFYTGRTISPKEDKELFDFVKKQDVLLQIIGIDTLKTAIRTKYQILGEKYLGIPIDSGQILDEISFRQSQSNNKLSTGFEQKFIGREEETQKILSELASHDILLLCGSAGVGKTKIGIEVCKTWCTQYPNFNSKFISPKTGQLNEEIYTHFENNSDYIVLVDDAFRIDDIEKLLFFNQGRYNKLKLILTVRDFAVKKIKKVVERLSLPKIEEVQIKRLNDETINELLKNIGVTNQECHYKINKLVNGNPRLALMAAKQALKVNNCEVLNDVSDIYDLYFKPYIDDRNIALAALKILGILSAFKVIRSTDIELHENIEKAFGISKNQLWENFIGLCENELVEFNDIDKLDIVRIADQTLASYIFYQVFIQRQLLSFSDLIQCFFTKNRGRIRDALRPILESYGFEKVKTKLKPLVDEARKKIENDLEANLFDFYDEFSFCQEEEILIFLNQVVNNTAAVPLKESDFKEANHWRFLDGYKYIELAKKLYHNSQHTILALQLTLKYLTKQPANFKDVVKYLLEEVYFHADDYDENYIIQVKLFEILLQEVSLKNEHERIYKQLLIEITGKYLQIVAKGIKPRSSINNFRFDNIYIREVTAWTQKRVEIWQYVINLIQDDIKSFQEIFKVALEIGNYKNIDSPILEDEAKFVVKLLDNFLNPDKLDHCIIAHKYLEYLSHCQIKTNKYGIFFKKFTTKTYRQYKILSFNYNSISRRFRKNEKRVKFEETQTLIIHYLVQKTKRYTTQDFLTLLDTYTEATSINYEVSWNLTLILLNLFEQSTNMFLEVVTGLFNVGNKGKFKSPKIVEKLLHIFKENEENLWFLIERYEFEAKYDWKLDYLFLLPQKLIEKKQYNRLVDCISKIDSLYLSDGKFTKIKEYESILHNGAFVELLTIIQKRSSANLLNFVSHDLIEKFANEFINDVEILKKLYFYFQQKHHLGDYDGKDFEAIFSLDNNFLTDYMNLSFPKEYNDARINNNINQLPFLWEKENYETTISLIFVFFTQKKHLYHDNDKFLKSVFTPRAKDNEKIIQFLKKKIEENPNKKPVIKLVFKIIAECFQNELTSFFEFFIQKSSSFDIFRSLPTKPTLMVYHNGSRVYKLMNEIEFWKKINKSLPLEIEYLEHRNYITQCIAYLSKEIEYEKRESFWKDY